MTPPATGAPVGAARGKAASGRGGLRLALWAGLLLASVAATLWFALAPHVAAVGDGEEGLAGRVEFLLRTPPEDIAAVELVDRGRLARIERDAAGAWLLHAHVHGPGEAAHTHVADPGASPRIAQAVGMFSRTRIERVIGPAQPAYGLDNPSLIVNVFAKGEARPVLRLRIGDLAPGDLSRYVLVEDGATAILIPDYQVQNLRTLFAGLGVAR